MPRGDNPNSRKNLRHLTSDEAREIGAKGGKATALSNKIRKSFREIDLECTTYEERKQMLDMLKLKAKHGNTRAFEIYRDTVGEKPENRLDFNGKINNPFEGLTTEELRKIVDLEG